MQKWTNILSTQVNKCICFLLRRSAKCASASVVEYLFCFSTITRIKRRFCLSFLKKQSGYDLLSELKKLKNRILFKVSLLYLVCASKKARFRHLCYESQNLELLSTSTILHFAFSFFACAWWVIGVKNVLFFMISIMQQGFLGRQRGRLRLEPAIQLARGAREGEGEAQPHLRGSGHAHNGRRPLQHRQEVLRAAGHLRFGVRYLARAESRALL